MGFPNQRGEMQYCRGVIGDDTRLADSLKMTQWPQIIDA